MDSLIPKLSILITAYNQTDLLRWNISTLLKNEPDDYEIVIQDDHSDEDLKNLITCFNDKRIRYIRNPSNYGHDRNVVEGFRNCKGSFVFLLRSSDTIIPGKIRTILDHIDKWPDIGYTRFSCIDESGKTRIQYGNSRYDEKSERIRINRTLLLHPSGELFNKRFLSDDDLTTIISYLDSYFHDKNRFVINELLRDKYTMTSPISVSEDVVWQYTRTVNREDIAQNRDRNGTCIYAPLYSYERFNCEISYIANELKGSFKEKSDLISHVFDHYARMCIHDFKRINKDTAMQKHYGYREVPFSSFKELRSFKENAGILAGKLPPEFRDVVYGKIQRLSLLSIGFWNIQDICFMLRFGGK